MQPFPTARGTERSLSTHCTRLARVGKRSVRAGVKAKVGVGEMVPDSMQELQAQRGLPSEILPRHTGIRNKYLAALGVIALLAMGSASLQAVSCITQASLQAPDREALLAAGNSIAGDVAGQNFDQLQASLLPAVVGEWESIRGAAQSAAPVLKGGKVYWGDGYLLDASDLKGPADTEFFCTNADSAATMTITLRSLPAGRYALLIGDYEGAPLAGQLALILGTDTTAAGKWKLGGLFVREGALDGHDGVWYWRRARELAEKKAVWSAWFSFDAARWLLIPVDFLSSPHLEKLNKEQSQLAANPSDSLPLTVTGVGANAGKSWRITGLHFDATLHTPDVGLVYESTGLTEPVAARAEAIEVMSALLKLHPELRENFHGLWAYAEKDGKHSYAIELAMHDIP
jgi:hypothetical protein